MLPRPFKLIQVVLTAYYDFTAQRIILLLMQIAAVLHEH